MKKMKLIDFLEKTGFYKYHTGGGCMSLRIGLDDDPEGPAIVLTDEEGVSIDEIEKEVYEGQKLWIGIEDKYDNGSHITLECTVMSFEFYEDDKGQI